MDGAIRLVRLPAPAHETPGAAGTLAGVPPAARIYVGLVCAVAGVVLLRAIVGVGPAPTAAMSLLMLLSLLASMIKVEIPVFGNASTLTACHVIDLIALVMYGTHAGVLVGAWGAWTQCTFRTRVRNPPHQTAFSVASLAVTMWTAGTVFEAMSGMPAGASSLRRWEPLGAAAAVFFVCNSGLVAGAVALTTAKRFKTIWFDFFFSSWPSYVIGAVLAAAVVTGIQNKSYWLVPILITALVLMHRNHKFVVERMNDAVTDSLTGLHNQRFVPEHVERELHRAARSGDSVAIAVLDLDDFKHINDRIGHAAGDLALRRVAEVLKQVVRESDVCARYGGDEFVIVMPSCTAPDARRRMDEARRAVAASSIDGQHKIDTSLSISAGIAVFPEDGNEFTTLFAVADSRMYECKRGRRMGWSRNA
jgi:diguanylate cyclase (GGDEF)-like protein